MREPAITDYRALTWPCRRLPMWNSRASPATKYGYRPTQPIGNSRTRVLQSIDPDDLPDFRNVIRSAFRVAGQADSNVRTARGPAGSTRRGANEAEFFVGGVRVEQMRVTPDAVGHALESLYFVCGPGSPFERRDPTCRAGNTRFRSSSALRRQSGKCPTPIRGRPVQVREKAAPRRHAYRVPSVPESD